MTDHYEFVTGVAADGRPVADAALRLYTCSRRNDVQASLQVCCGSLALLSSIALMAIADVMMPSAVESRRFSRTGKYSCGCSARVSR